MRLHPLTQIGWTLFLYVICIVTVEQRSGDYKRGVGAFFATIALGAALYGILKQSSRDDA